MKLRNEIYLENLSFRTQYGLINLASVEIIPLINHEYCLIAGSLESAYSLNWGAREIWGKGGGETLALL